MAASSILFAAFISIVPLGILRSDLAFYRSDYSTRVGHMSPSMTCTSTVCDTFYGIMFDAGSTGTRIHIYTFVQNTPAEPPHLDKEIFESVKPGLSAYVDQPEVF
ncbi:ectonucleoside triphosphate diphosphohydrolase 5-like [Protopterus annectens]|uniref:ectonucleoside triphosphate diphosphohydrolase 5-like n=1 Tax=Protopterus annectens TaxID=7888 RepID=UPI001CF9B6CD|nr:ectonucleoside triphosphate diphosphohydrolase 5-like [Protopterus annectens]